MRERVERAIEKIRPALGINVVELVDVAGEIVKVRVISSACSAGIPPETVLVLLEEQLEEDVPEIKHVVAVD